MLANQEDIEQLELVPRPLPQNDYPRRVFVGVRRSGKTFMLYQKIKERIAAGIGWDKMLYINFEDDRLIEFSVADFDLILQCHAELYDARPMLFLDEVQVVEGWEKFARRLGDANYEVWITGSNSKMLSGEIMSTLGGRYLVQEVYPYSFREYLSATQTPCDERSLLRPTSRAKVLRQWNEYLRWGGLPESVGHGYKRDYLSSTFQKIYLGDIAQRYRLSNPQLLRLLLKKMADTVMTPVAYKRLENVLSSVRGKVSVPTVISYIEQSESAWLLFRLRNLASAFSDKETSCKYYFVDNGILNLFLVGGETALLENIVAMELFRRYGHDLSNDRVYYYHDRVEVDFYVPDDQLAIQVCYSLGGVTSTYDRKVDALHRLPKVHPCARRLILTNDESATITDEFGTIEVHPAWRWILQ